MQFYTKQSRLPASVKNGLLIVLNQWRNTCDDGQIMEDLENIICDNLDEIAEANGKRTIDEDEVGEI
jgi:hypothetical protein